MGAATVTSGSGNLKAELKGAAQLRRTLKAAGDDLSDLQEAHSKAAAIVEENALGLVPVDTGFLASTIRSSGTKTAGVVRAGTRAVPYAGPIHFGWPARNIAANPFIQEAAHLTEPIWGRIFEDAVAKAIDRIKGI